MQMIVGGGLLLLAGAVTGEPAHLRHTHTDISVASVAALLHLIVFGSLVGHSAYNWLLRTSTPAKASSYAYVNPVVALALGWALADEPVTPRTLAAAGVILSAVVTITISRPPADGGPIEAGLSETSQDRLP